MQVIATAGHVDHGKSTLVRALTGIEPDRWAEERRRGMTIDLGYAWTTLPSAGEVAFVDVPGHERFLGNMLAGVGPVPAVMFVVAADEGWQPQSEEHLQALTAFGVERALLVVTKSDLADPVAAMVAARERLRDCSLASADAVAVSALSGTGMDELVAALDRLAASLPSPSRAAPVRLWVDRSFTVAGAGTVVTGTLPRGELHVGDELLALTVTGERRVTIRGLQSHQRAVDAVTGVARVAVNLRGVARDDISRGAALVSPDAWTRADVVDVRIDGTRLPGELVAHVGSAAVPARVRRLDERTARLRMASALPLHVGDRILLRDPGSRQVTGATVLDVAPAPLRRRGDAARHAGALTWPRTSMDEVDRLGVVAVDRLRLAGFAAPVGVAVVAGWAVADRVLDEWRGSLPSYVDVEVATAVKSLGLPTPELLPVLLDGSQLAVRDGRIAARRGADPDDGPGLPALLDRLTARPFEAPTAAELADLRVDAAALSRWTRAGHLVRLGREVWLAAGAPARAADVLAQLPQPFTVSDARTALASSRRTVVPLLEHLDAARVTRRNPDGTRLLVRVEA